MLSNRDDVYVKRVKSQVVEQKIPSTLFLVMQVQSQLLGPLQTPVDMPWRWQSNLQMVSSAQRVYCFRLTFSSEQSQSL